MTLVLAMLVASLPLLDRNAGVRIPAVPWPRNGEAVA